MQRRARRLVPDLRDLSYEERLYNLNLPTLEYRRKRGDLIQLYKMIHGMDDIDVTKFVSFSTNTTRGHTLKLNKPRCKKSVRLNAFPARCIDESGSFRPYSCSVRSFRPDFWGESFGPVGAGRFGPIS